MAESQILIRRMEELDIPHLMQIEQQSFSSPWSEMAFRSELIKVYAITRVALFTGHIIGYGIANYVLNEGHILNLAVHQDFRRKGVATRLMEEILQTLKKKGCIFCYLEVRASNTIGHRFYEVLGYQIVGRRRKYYQKPVEDAVLMFRSI